MITPYMNVVGITTKIVPHGHWSEKDENNNFINRIHFIELLGKKLGYTNINDWYKVKQKDAEDFGGAGLLSKYYNRSITQLLQETFPNEWFVPWLFTNAPQGYWNSIENVELYIDWLAEKKQYKTIEDLYNLRTEDFKSNSGMGIISKFNNTIQTILEAVYPEKTWLPFLFTIATMSSQKDRTTHIVYLKWLEKKLGITSPEQWYDKCNKPLFDINKGNGLIRNSYNGSPTSFIYTMYPDYPWKWYKFTQSPHGSWDDKIKVKEWFDDLLKYYNITNMEDVYTLNRMDILNFYGNGGMDRYKGYINLIVENIPYTWDKIKFVKNGYSKKAINFLDRLAKDINVPIQHKLNSQDGEKKLGRIAVDGYISQNDAIKIPSLTSITGDIIIEYNGCCYHGCLKCYPNRLEKTWFSNKSYQYHYEYTEKRKQKLITSGYIVIDIWECEDNNSLDLVNWFNESVNQTGLEEL
jgi:hypothetical protein